ncbi:MAG: bacillithiol system redox-active protein YtxJ [Crocinitomicaceae bacterium]|nr:bacillithiol system redox-active protein YtxJ [Crocinitomicaceae bacterium]
MGLFSKSNTLAEARINWVQLEDRDKLNYLISQSEYMPVLLFKHSTRCSISIMAKSRLESDWDLTNEQIIPVYLDLLMHRSISNEIADIFGVKHESPQVLLIKDGICVYDASHSQISVKDLKEHL